MSSGTFQLSRYEDDDGTVHPIRVLAPTIAATIGSTANAAPTGAVTDDISARVSAGRRTLGLCARLVTVKWDTKPTGYTGIYARIPVLKKSVYDGCSKGDTVTYAGGSGKIAGKIDEQLN